VASPPRARARADPFAREVKELALDLRGQDDSVEAERRLEQANDALMVILRHSGRRAA